MGMRKKHTSEFKSKVAMAALREDRTMTELSSEYGVHPIQIGIWKKTVRESMSRLFEGKNESVASQKEQKQLLEKLYRKIGELEVENDWIKKKLGI